MVCYFVAGLSGNIVAVSYEACLGGNVLLLDIAADSDITLNYLVGRNALACNGSKIRIESYRIVLVGDIVLELETTSMKSPLNT